MSNVLYHYTNIDKLALILKNKTIRFNSLNNMDDIQENMTADINNFGRFFYVSCWTSDAKENIALWKQYTEHDSGVRIDLPKNPFKKYNLFDAFPQYNGKGIKIAPNTFSFFDPKVIANANWFTTNIVDDDLCIPIEYTENEEKLIPKILEYDASNNTTNIKHNEVGRYKDLAWGYQKEYRYIFSIILGNLFSGVNDSFKQISENLKAMCRGEAEQPFSFYDMKIDDEAFKQMKVVLSPTISSGNEILVRSVLEKYNQEAIIIDSSFKDKIR